MRWLGWARGWGRHGSLQRNLAALSLLGKCQTPHLTTNIVSLRNTRKQHHPPLCIKSSFFLQSEWVRSEGSCPNICELSMTCIFAIQLWCGLLHLAAVSVQICTPEKWASSETSSLHLQSMPKSRDLNLTEGRSYFWTQLYSWNIQAPNTSQCDYIWIQHLLEVEYELFLIGSWVWTLGSQLEGNCVTIRGWGLAGESGSLMNRSFEL